MFDGVNRGAVVVAHPDDESLWFGGLLARYPGRWTVICCSIPRADPVRAWKFFDACAELGAEARLWPFTEPSAQSALENLPGGLGGFDAIVTHNARGEYGHRHHMDVNRHVTGLFPSRAIVTGYGVTAPMETLRLTTAELERKGAALRRYNHSSPHDGKPKWEALLARYGQMFDLGNEPYVRHSA